MIPNTIFALMLVFTPPNGEPIGVPLERNFTSFQTCMEARDAYLQADPGTPGIVMCYDQGVVDVPANDLPEMVLDIRDAGW